MSRYYYEGLSHGVAKLYYRLGEKSYSRGAKLLAFKKGTDLRF